MTKTQLLQGFC